MHAPVEAREVEEVSERAPPPQHEGIEEPHLDVGLRVERGERFVEAAGVVVVEQQPHPDAAIGGAAQCVEQQRAREVVVPDVVLHIEAALGDIGEPNPRGERIASTEQWNDARQPRMRLGERSDRPPEPALGGVLQPDGDGAVVQRGQDVQPCNKASVVIADANKKRSRAGCMAVVGDHAEPAWAPFLQAST